MTGTPHTPTPWRLVPLNKAMSPFIVGDREGGSIADCEPPGPWMISEEAVANAVFIVRAVNAHDDLVKTLTAAHKMLLRRCSGDVNGGEWIGLICGIENILAKAGGAS